MSFVSPPSRAHTRGWTTAIFDANGDHLLSAGADGLVKIFTGIGDCNPMEHVIGEKINAIAFREDTIVVATEGMCVHSIQIEDGLPEGLATRFTAEVTHATLSKDRSKLAACSSDFSIKVVNYSSPEDREFKLEGHSGGVLSVAFDPLDIFLASASCDGTVRIWLLEARREIKVIRSLSPCNDTALALSFCRLCWEASNGEFLAVPVDKQICLYERSTWAVLCYLSCSSIAQPINVCVSSFDGAYLSAGSDDGWIVLWRVKDRLVIHRLRDPSHSAICSLAWHPQQDCLLLCANKNGFISLVRFSLNQPTTDGALSLEEMNDLMGCDEDGDTDELLRVAAAQAESSRLVDEEEAQNLLNGSASDNDDADSIDLSKLKSGFLALSNEVALSPTKVEPLGQLPEVSAPLPVVASGPQFQKPFQPGSMPLSFRERFMVWNRIGVVIQYGRDSDELPETETMDADGVGSIEVEFHDATQHHSLRLANRVGYTMADLSLTALLLASPGSDDPTLADDFDSGEPLDAADQSQIAMLPLDVRMSGGAGESASSEWTAKLPAGEACQAICLVPHEDPDERGYAVVATTKRLLRLFLQPAPAASASRPSNGLHLFQITKLGLPPISIPGTGVVAMCSHHSRSILAVIASTNSAELIWRVYYLGGVALGSSRTQTPSWLTGALSTWQPLPLSPVPDTGTINSRPLARLMWFGFSDHGGLYTHDSTGLVRRLLHTHTKPRADHHWAPVCDTRAMLKSTNRRSDSYFLTGILETSPALGFSNDQSESTKDAGLGQLQAIYCKASKWPRVFPRPVLSSLSFRLPLCSLGTDQSNLEESCLRCLINDDWPVWSAGSADEVSDQHQLSDQCLLKRKGVLLRLFALAAKLDSDWASVAVARLMPDAGTVQLAIRYAGRLRRQHLAQKLAEVALDKERSLHRNEVASDQESEEEDSDMDDHDYAAPISGTSRRTVTDRARSSETTRVLSPIPGPRKSKRNPSGTPDDPDLTNVSLVSSATDETQDESHLTGLPLPDSETYTQSALLPSTPGSARNPFRESSVSGPIASSSDPKRKIFSARGRGSEIFDTWQPQPSNSSELPLKASQHNKSREPRMSKKRAAASAESSMSKRSKQAKVVATRQKPVESPSSTEFLDWFEEHRIELEEEFPEQSVEELMHTARLKFLEVHPSEGRCARSKSDRDLNKENQRPNSKTHVNEVKKRSSETTSKRLSTFRFEADSPE